MTSRLPRATHDGAFKPHNDKVPRPSTRYGQEAEPREHKQHTAANGELQKNLTETKQRLALLEQQHRDLQGENEDMQKRLKDCHVLLVAGNIDPVLGEIIGRSTQQNEDEQREMVNVSRELLGELVAFCDMTAEQRSRLDEVQKTMQDLTEAREALTQERSSFSLEVEEMEKALEEAEMLLLE